MLLQENVILCRTNIQKSELKHYNVMGKFIAGNEQMSPLAYVQRGTSFRLERSGIEESVGLLQGTNRCLHCGRHDGLMVDWTG